MQRLIKRKINNGTRLTKGKNPTQIVGNTGLYFICYELSKRGWNVMPTSRNAKGIDLIIYNQSATETHTIQIKSLSKKSPVPMSEGSLLAEYVIICRCVFDSAPEVFIAKTKEIRPRIHEGTSPKTGQKSYWLQPKDYESFRDNWELIGDGV